MVSIVDAPKITRRLTDVWSDFSLSQKFALASGIVMLAGMIVVGSWVAREVEQGVTKSTAHAAALYVDSFISPLTQEIAGSENFSVGQIRALDEALRDSPLGKRLVSVKIWKQDGTIAYSLDYDLIGQKFEPTTELKAAFAGQVLANFDDLHDEEDKPERSTGLPILEIYSPVRAPWSGQVIAVVEFYENGLELQKSINKARLGSWLAVAGIMLSIGAILMGIVHKGSRTIEEQRKTLRDQLREVTRTSEQNKLLRERAQKASQRVAELNEQYLKRVSADLHDGPAQLLAFASLKMNTIGKTQDPKIQQLEVDAVNQSLVDAMQDIRNICRGLALPEIKQLSIRKTIERVVNLHIERTGTHVDLTNGENDLNASHPIKICVFRFVQEALNNAWQHAGGKDQAVIWDYDARSRKLNIRVSDGGAGIPARPEGENMDGLGIQGMRERLESIGGTLTVDSSAGSGTTLSMQVDLGLDVA